MTKTLITDSRKRYQNQYAHINDIGEFDAEYFNPSYRLSSYEVRGYPIPVYTGRRRYSDRQIENLARSMLLKIWEKAKAQSDEAKPRDQINPEKALGLLGYRVEHNFSIGQVVINGQAQEVGGTIDKESKQVRISPQLAPEVMNFTAAHELGHAILHEANGLHRDRPLDGSAHSGTRDTIEYEADKFASYFLMPKKQIQKAFKQIYGTMCFHFDESRVFALTRSTSELFRRKYPSLRRRSRLLASSEQFNGRHFPSLAKQFKVSTEAMAIRLEELKLLD